MFENIRTLQRPVQQSQDDVMVSKCVNELMNARNSFHKMHLKISGIGSFAGHSALNELYDELPDFADALAEQYQGASEKLLTIPEDSQKILNSVEESLSYIRELYSMITQLQSILSYSEIVNELDSVKSHLNKIKYKLLFLK